MTTRVPRSEHEVKITLAGVGYQARCSCGWWGVQRASDTAIRDAKRDCDEHRRVLDRSDQ